VRFDVNRQVSNTEIVDARRKLLLFIFGDFQIKKLKTRLINILYRKERKKYQVIVLTYSKKNILKK
jgi:hypothetical protein